jgi:hypothetical protein
MANKIKVHNTSGISSQKKASLTPDNASLNNGLFNSHIVEAITEYNSAPAERVLQGPGNQFIVMGRDRPRGVSSGYGGAGHSHAASIDIIAGMAGIMSRESTSGGEVIVTDKSPELDAARIYISQRSNIDDYFHLAEGSMGGSDARSAIAIKADDVRVVSRNGIKLVTGTDTHEASGIPSTIISGIDLIAGNDDEDLQPLVKGDSLAAALEELSELVADLNGILFSFTQAYLQLISALAVHTHIGAPLVGGPTSPSVDLATSCLSQLSNIGSLGVDLTAHQKNVVGWNLNTIYPWGENYIKSSYNNTN